MRAFQLFGLTLLFSLPLGLIIAFGSMSKWEIRFGGAGKSVAVRPISALMKTFVWIIRGTPLMLQLLICFFGPYYIFGMTLHSNYRFTAVIIAFALNYAAYFAEIYRAGIESISVGQYEAAKVLGYTPVQTFFRIIFPQVFKRILPPLTNEAITLVKDTSLAFSLSVLEMFTIAKQIASAHATMIPFVVAGVFYYVFNFLVASGMGHLEKRMNYYR